MKTEQIETAVQTADGRELRLSARIYKPDVTSSGATLFCLPGGGASHEYFNLGQYDDEDYSFASRMTAMGHRVISMDHPGTGGNPLPDDHPFLTPRQSSDYIAQACSNIFGDDASKSSNVIGLGHSMGGMTTILTQARHRPFKALALLGSSAGGLDWGLDEHEKTYVGKPDAVERDLEELVIRKFGSPFLQVTGGPSGTSITFGGASEKLTERLREISIPLYGAGGMMSMIRGSFLDEVEAIDVPLFFAFGDHDIGLPPEEAPAPFIGTGDVELHILENCGHNSFAFPVIESLCAKLDRWARRIQGIN